MMTWAPGRLICDIETPHLYWIYLRQFLVSRTRKHATFVISSHTVTMTVLWLRERNAETPCCNTHNPVHFEGRSESPAQFPKHWARRPACLPVWFTILNQDERSRHQPETPPVPQKTFPREEPPQLPESFTHMHSILCRCWGWDNTARSHPACSCPKVSCRRSRVARRRQVRHLHLWRPNEPEMNKSATSTDWPTNTCESWSVWFFVVGGQRW